MAYLNTAEFGGLGAAGERPRPVPAAVGSSLSSLEWSVVALARKDGRGSLRRPGVVSTLLRALFAQRNPQLADDRLEALRRIAVLSWQDGYAVPPHEVRAFLAAGFSADQYETLVDAIRATIASDVLRTRLLRVAAA